MAFSSSSQYGFYSDLKVEQTLDGPASIGSLTINRRNTSRILARSLQDTGAFTALGKRASRSWTGRERGRLLFPSGSKGHLVDALNDNARAGMRMGSPLLDVIKPRRCAWTSQ